MDERFVGIEIEGIEAKIRLFVGESSKDSQTHVLITGYTISGDVFIPIANSLLSFGFNVVIVDPITLFDIKASELARVIQEDVNQFRPRGYAKRLNYVIEKFKLQNSIFWGESMGAHFLIHILNMRPGLIGNLILVNPVGIRHNILSGWKILDMAVSGLLDNTHLLSSLANLNVGKQVREWIYEYSRMSAGNPVYPSQYLKKSIDIITSDHSVFYSSMVLPLLAINKDLIDAKHIYALSDISFKFIFSDNDKMLLYHVNESGDKEDYRSAWIKMTKKNEKEVLWLKGGHEAIFSEELNVDILLKKILR